MHVFIQCSGTHEMPVLRVLQLTTLTARLTCAFYTMLLFTCILPLPDHFYFLQFSLFCKLARLSFITLYSNLMCNDNFNNRFVFLGILVRFCCYTLVIHVYYIVEFVWLALCMLSKYPKSTDYMPVLVQALRWSSEGMSQVPRWGERQSYCPQSQHVEVFSCCVFDQLYFQRVGLGRNFSIILAIVSDNMWLVPE